MNAICMSKVKTCTFAFVTYEKRLMRKSSINSLVMKNIQEFFTELGAKVLMKVKELGFLVLSDVQVIDTFDISLH